MSSSMESQNRSENEGFEMNKGKDIERTQRHAVRVFNASKNYGKNIVLSNLNMSVKEGSIYALLGSSGCGKTTLLACCVGIRKLKEGEIHIFGHSPGSREAQVPGKRVGYMPQEIALFKEFTIKEALEYYGKIAGMKQSNIDERASFLVKFLELPLDISREVRNLSGGQQRRLSFAAALIHEPELLVLDEPTVGVDPLLRQCIWTHLMEITSTMKTTIIITTHYIEEASQATTVGIMRSGKLLTENSPEFLQERYKMTLERTVLHLCELDSADNELLSSSHSGDSSNNSVESLHPQICAQSSYKSENPNSCSKNEKNSIAKTLGNSNNRISALVKKNFLCIWRNIGFLPFLFCLPAIQLILCCYIIGNSPLHIDFGYINHEMGLEECPSANQKSGECIFANLSCNFMNELPAKKFNFIQFELEDQAIDAIKKGHIWGFISIPKNFSETLIEFLVSSATSLDKDSIVGSKPQVQMDMTNQQIGFSVKKAFYETYENFTRALLENCEIGTTSSEFPVKFLEPVYGTNEPKFINSIAPGAFLLLNVFMVICLTSQVLITEKKEGMFERNLVAGVTQFESILSHTIAQYGIMLGQYLLSFFIIFVWFHIPNEGSILLIILLAILQGTVGMLFGFLISTICDEERTVFQLVMGLFFPNSLLSAVLFPIETLPAFLKYIAWYLPQTLALESMRSMFGRGWGLDHPSVSAGFFSSLIWIFLLIALILISSLVKFRSK